MKLGEYFEPLAYDAAFWMLGLDNPSHPIGEMGKLALDVSGKLRVLAIISLLARDSSDGFLHNLMRSGKAREKYLARIRRELAVTDHHFVVGRYEPFLDSLAAGDWSLARRIVELSPDEWSSQHEYEDDFLYARVLHGLVQGRPRDFYEPLLARFEDVIEESPRGRLDVAKALAAADQAAFDDAFESLLDERAAEIEAADARGQLLEPGVVANREVFVEGLALLRLAGHRGLQTEDEYRFCPGSARVPMKKPFPGE
jgi:immunity protein 49 of polymorphic toxin system